MNLPLFTNSRAKTARSCQRKHRLRYIDGFRAVRVSENQHFGTLVHAGLEGYFLQWKLAGPGPACLDAALAAVQVEADPFERTKAEALLVGYDARWGDEPYEVLSVEQQFEAPLLNPATGAESKTWRLAGKLDLMLRDLRDGRTLLAEHKTSSEDIRQGSDYWRRLRMDSQVSIYFDGAYSLGHDVAGCLYDVIGKPALRPSQVPILDEDGVKVVRDRDGARVRTKDGKKWRETSDNAAGYALQTRTETPEEYRARLVESIAADPAAYFQRAEVSRLEAELDEARQDTWQLAQQMREAQRLRRFPRNPDSCLLYGTACEFFDVCSGAASLDDTSRFRRETDVHPELAAPPVNESAVPTQGAA